MTHQQQNDWLTIPTSIIIAGLLIAVGIYLGAGIIANGNVTPTAAAPAPKAEAKAVTTASKPRTISASEHIQGSATAKAVIIEYSDIDCPFCQRFHPTLQSIVDKYGKDGSVAWVYRHFPLDSLHPNARKKAEATECAAELGGNTKFWEYLETLYGSKNQDGQSIQTFLANAAESIGLDKRAFERCLSSGKYTSKVEQDVTDGINVGARGTPYSMIVTKDKTVPINGAMSLEGVEKLVKESIGIK